MQPLGGGSFLQQKAVDAILDLHLPIERLDMNVARARLNRFIDNQVDEVDKRRLPRQLMQLGGREIAVAQVFIRPLFRGRQIVQHPGHVAAIEFQHGVLKLGRVRIKPLNQTTRHQPQVFCRLQLKRVRHRHRQTAVLPPQRQDVVFAHQLSRHKANDLAADGHHRQVDLLNPRLDRKGLVQVSLCYIPQLQEDLAQLPVLDLLLGQGNAQIGLIEVGPFTEQFTQFLLLNRTTVWVYPHSRTSKQQGCKPVNPGRPTVYISHIVAAIETLPIASPDTHPPCDRGLTQTRTEIHGDRVHRTAAHHTRATVRNQTASPQQLIVSDASR